MYRILSQSSIIGIYLHGRRRDGRDRWFVLNSVRHDALFHADDNGTI